MKRFLFVSALCLCIFVSCSLNINSRKVSVLIPIHQWEKESAIRLWYTLKWNDGNETKSLRVNYGDEDVLITIPVGETVCICAYPLDRLNPLGALVGPQDNSSVIVLNEQDGVLAGNLINLNHWVICGLNPPVIKQNIENRVKDYRDLDYVVFLKDLLNNSLDPESFKTKTKTKVTQFAAKNGYWIAENSNDSSFYVTEELTPEQTLSEGSHFWFSPQNNMELIITVNNQGQTSSSIKPSDVNKT